MSEAGEMNDEHDIRDDLDDTYMMQEAERQEQQDLAA